MTLDEYDLENGVTAAIHWFIAEKWVVYVYGCIDDDVRV